MMTSTYLKDVAQASRKAFVFVGIFSFFVNIFMLTVPLYMLQLFDRVLVSQSYETLIYLTVIALIALFVMGLMDIARSRVLIKISHWLDNKLSPIALGRSADEVLQGRTYGSQSLRDISTIRQFVGGPGIFALFDSPWVPMYLIMIFLMHSQLGLLATFGAIILFVLAIFNELSTRKLLERASNEAIKTQLHTDATMRNMEVIQAMGMLPNIVKTWFDKNEKAQNLQVTASNRTGSILAISKFFRLSLQLLMLGLGAYYVVQNEITPGVMIAASILMSRALAPVEQAISAWKQMQAARQSYHRLVPHFAKETLRTAGIKLPTPTGNLSLENVYFVPTGAQHPIINNISFQVPAGKMIAIVGPSAAGKTSLARLIVGAWQASAGSVRLDGANVYTWERSDFGKHVGYLPQDVELFSGTVKVNIARMEEVDDEAVIAAAKLAGVHQMILHLPQGYNTEIGMEAYTLSGGQRQRIALARALYKSPKLIVLDEPNSNLDNEGEQALIHTLKQCHEAGLTILLIAHHPAIIHDVDDIIVLNEGRIQFAGPRDKILTQMQEIRKQHGKQLEIKKYHN